MKNFTQEQMEFIKEKYEDIVQDAIDQRVDNELIYHSDIEDWVNHFTTIVAVLNGEYTMGDLYEDLYDYYYNDNFEDVVEEVYDELDEEQQKEIDNLDN